MPNQRARQLMIENFQDSLRLVRHLMNFGVEEFAEAIGVTRQTINNLETKKAKMSVMQYIAIAALTDSYFAQNSERFTALKAILDGDGKNYGTEYETAFRDDSLLKRWFEDCIDFGEDDASDEEFPICAENALWALAKEYKIFLDAELLKAADAAAFIDELTAVLKCAKEKAIMPLRSIEQFKATATPQESKQAMTFIQQMRNNNVLNIHGEESDPDFHDTILAVFKRFRDTYNCCLITPDEKLAREVLQLENDDEDDQEITAGFVAAGTFRFYDKEELAAAEDTAEDSNPVTSEENDFSGWETI